MFLRTRPPRHGILRITKQSIRFQHTGAQSPSRPPIIQIENGTFYQQYPSSHTSSLPLLKNVNFTLPSFSNQPQHWAVIGTSPTAFLQILRGEHVCLPPDARRYPYLSSKEIEDKDVALRLPLRAIQYVGFDNNQPGLSGSGTAGTYLSARYESRREATDFSLLDYLQGNTSLNALQESEKQSDHKTLQRVVKDLKLEDLLNMPVSNLSNGQTRRAKIARALLSKPEVLLLDEPFLGLDPATSTRISSMLRGLAVANEPRLILSLRSLDRIPDWTTHLLVLGGDRSLAFRGPKEMLPKGMVLNDLKDASQAVPTICHSVDTALGTAAAGATKEFSHKSLSRDGYRLKDTEESKIGEPVVEMEGIRVTYGEKTVLGNWQDTASQQSGLWWTVRRGERWGIFGPNGSGKTTMISLICSDHPQTYSLPIKLFGKSRLPAPGEPGISIFDLQARIGHCSPEIYNHFPRNLTVRQTLENAWAETLKGVPVLITDAKAIIERCLSWFEPELRPDFDHANHTGLHLKKQLQATRVKESYMALTTWADHLLFGELSFGAQKVALLLRAIIKNPDLVILDEAFSGMSEAVRDKCMLFLAHGEVETWADEESNSPCIGGHVVPIRNIFKGSKPLVAVNEAPQLFRGLQDHQALICISHLPEEVPGSVRDWICLPESSEKGAPARMGRLEGPLEVDGYRAWDEIWGVERTK